MNMELEEGEYVEEEEMEQRRFAKTKTAMMDKRRGREEDGYDTVSMELDSEPETSKTNGAMLEELEDDADLLRRQLLSQVRKKKAKKPTVTTTSKATSTSEITKTTTLTPKMSKVTTTSISKATSSSTSSEKATLPLVSVSSPTHQTPKNGKAHLQAENPVTATTTNGLPQMKEKLSQLHEQLTVAQLKQSTIVRKKRRLQDSLVQCESDLVQSQSEINSIVEAILGLWADAADTDLKPALMESKKEPTTTKSAKSPKLKEALTDFTTPSKKLRLEENKDSPLKTPISHQTPSKSTTKSEGPIESKKREEKKRGTETRKEDERVERRKRDREREGGRDDEKQRKGADERQKSEKDKQRKEDEHPRKEESETTKLEKKQKTDTMKKTAETDELQKEQQSPTTSKAKTAEETTQAGERAEQPPRPTTPSPTKTPESTPEKSPNVDSFLASIRAYRLNPHFPHSMLTHFAVSNKLDPYVPLCPFQLDGICADKNCPWQHESEYRLSDVELVAEVIGLWPKLCPVGIQPKAYAARLLATDSLDTVIGFLLSTMPEEAHRIKLDIVKGIPRLCKPIPPGFFPLLKTQNFSFSLERMGFFFINFGKFSDEKIDFVPFLISSTNHHRQQRSETVSPPLIL